MNLDALSKRLDALEEILRGLRAEIDSAKQKRDPFAVHVFLARAEYDRAVVLDGKGGKRIERALQDTYKRARELGFQGSLNEWWNILWLGRPETMKARWKAYG